MALTELSPPAVEHAAVQTSLFGMAPVACNPITAAALDLDDRSTVLFQPGWLNGSDQVFAQLRDEMPWQAMERPMYDRVVAVPRLICNVRPSDLQPDHALSVITSGLEAALGKRFDRIGLNLYRDGSDSVAWHRDRLGRRHERPRTVALVSLGTPRIFALRRFRHPAQVQQTPQHPPLQRRQPHHLQPLRQHSGTAETTRIPPATPLRWSLGAGDLLVLDGACQHDWEHSVPKQPTAGPRISLAFRC